jgi:uncharacterized protein
MRSNYNIIPYASIAIILFGLLILLFFPHPNQHTIRIDSFHSIHVEIADTPAKFSQGLMFRKYLPKEQGMLFKFPYSKAWAFWMKNTLIPLDIIWLNEHKQVIYYLDKVQPCKDTSECPLYTPPHSQKARYVLEIASGERHRLHIQLKQKLHF